MDTQGSSLLKPLAEVHIDIDISPEGATTDKACHRSIEGPRSNGTATAKASQESRAATEVTQTAKVNENYRQLFRAVVKGDWKTAERILDADEEAMMTKVMTVEKTSISVLEVAVRAAQDQFVENLVKRLSRDNIDTDFLFKRSLHEAARRGRIRMVKALVDKANPARALELAISHAPMQKEVIWYLSRRTTSMPRYRTRRHLIMAGHLDISLHLACQYPRSAPSELNENMRLLSDLAKMKSYFRSGARINFWEKCIYTCIPLYLIDTTFDNSKDSKMAPASKRFKIALWNFATKLAPFIRRIGESKWRHKCSFDFAYLALTGKKTHMETPQILEYLLTSGILLDAASLGISEIVGLCLEHFPELIWEKNISQSLMMEVVSGRHVELFRLVNAYNRIPKLSDSILTDRSLMEAVVARSPGYVSANIYGTAFLLQRELQWYKVLEDRSDPFFKSLTFKVEEDTSNPSCKSLKLIKTKEKGGKTYWEVFVEQRRDLLKDAGQWMKDTSSSCSLVATLIITIAFAAAFTIPGGSNGNTGIPIFSKKGSFMVFAIADALALFSSVTATLMFLAILTSRYAIEDFRHSLPRKMILGLTFLFLSLALMLVAFGSALTIILSERLKWIYIPIILLASFPGVLFLILQLPLYVEMVESTICPRLYQPQKLRK